MPFNGHSDRGRDINGDEIIIISAANDLSPPAGCSTSGVEKVRLSDSQKTCVMPLFWGDSTHMSVNNVDGHPWVLVSNTEYLVDSAAPAPSLPVDWEDLWGVYFNELTLVKLDGSEIIRLAHHRSRVLDNYYHQPRASLSRDGRYVLFDSNFGLSPISNYTDVYLIDTQD